MSHEIESIAWTGEKPWHGLGVEVSGDLTPQEILVAAGLDWEVRKYSTFARVGDKQVSTGKKALIRLSDNKVLSSDVGPNWEPIQNIEAFEFFDEFVDSNSMTMETAGSLKGGKIVWGLAKVGEAFELFGGDTVESYLLFSNSHQYGRTTVIDHTAVRVVCNNTLTEALSQKGSNRVTLSHRAKFDPEEAKELLGLAHMKLDNYREAAEFLGSKRASEEDVVEFMNALWPVKGEDAKKQISLPAKKALEAVTNQPGAQFAEGSWWQAFNAATYTTDHILSRDAETRLFQTWFGYHRDTKEQALKLAQKMANKSADMVTV